jgi:hypothetical protein
MNLRLFLTLILCVFAMPVQAYEEIKDSFYFMKDDGEFSAEEKDEEAMYIYEQCSENIMQNTYFKCDCVAGAYRQARDEGPIKPQTNLLYSIFKDKAEECINKPAIAGEAYEFCQNHARMFRAREPNNEEYCECVARKSVTDFAKDPKLKTYFISDIHIDALTSCERDY